jgi:HlyD family secretion protein
MLASDYPVACLAIVQCKSGKVHFGKSDVTNLKRWGVIVVVIAVLGGGGYYYWKTEIAARLPDGIVASNGRIEATQINIATKLAGRVTEITVNEGDMVEKGQVLARLDADAVTAQLKSAEANVRRLMRSREEAEASAKSYQSQLKLAGQMLDRARKLNKESFASVETLQQRTTEFHAAEAAYTSALARVAETTEAINAAEQDVLQVKTLFDDTVLTAPIRGRVQYRLVEPGEVVAAGGNLLTILNLADVYMTVFLPADEAGPLAIGSDARLILDPVPQYVIPAKVSFVAADAQFTPKAVETAEERAKLMFRVKISIDPTLLRKYEERVKAGVRGIAYVRIPPADSWPVGLQVALPE